jgi:hypothetical protein
VTGETIDVEQILDARRLARAATPGMDDTSIIARGRPVD